MAEFNSNGKVETGSKVWDLAENAIQHATRTLLYGPPGTGKTTAGVRAGSPDNVYKVTMHPEMAAAELEGHFVPNGDKFVWHDGIAVRAWRDGARLVIDEIDEASGDCTTLLYAILDDPGVAALTLASGKTVFPQEGFSVVATMNGHPRDLPPALRDRFEVAIEINEPHPDAIKSLNEGYQNLAKGSTGQSDRDRQFSVRSWKAFQRLESGMGRDDAAHAVFGESEGASVVESLSNLELEVGQEIDRDAEQQAFDTEGTA